ncbi:MAG: hypothetical protein A2Y54_07510 [Chloroflexi bacterium RBG_16_51_16]|nr:MAG: hypothetical protein A2Y54_07510 [Chloroflexi bacterium RBG_16_51_16]
MTFSIAACDLTDQSWGVAVASKFPAVGSVVPWAKAGSGVVATQSFANTSFGAIGIELMSSGLPAEDVIKRLLDEDPGKESRQVGLVDQLGRAATFTGKACYQWAGGLTGEGYAIQGNILIGAQVVKAMENGFLESKHELPGRLYAALVAGDRAGGDRRGRQSAAIIVVKASSGYGGFNDRWIDYRVDDHEDPVRELGKLLELHSLYFGKSVESDRIQLHNETVNRIQRILIRLKYLDGEPDGVFDKKTQIALKQFIGNENFEERADPEEGWIDAPVLDYLFSKFEN